jgi:MFS family permease
VLPQPGNRRKSSRWPALTVLCVSILIVNLDSTVLNVALPTLVRDLHTRLTWTTRLAHSSGETRWP